MVLLKSEFLKFKPHPFLKWAGGKRQLLSQLEKWFPKNYNNYIEPFVGGGAVFFHISPRKAILIDINEDLIDCYKLIKKNVYALIELLKFHKNDKQYYYKLRNQDRNEKKFRQMSTLEKVSRFIYLNRCCYNGLYRVNSKGQFNVPFGKYINPNFCDEGNLLAVHKALQNVELIHGSFEDCLNFAKANDFIYFDPPYHPISKTSSFTSYTKDNFGKNAQIKLYNVFKELDTRDCKVMLSNSYDEFILDMYKDYYIKLLDAKRAINSDSTKRGFIKEVLIMNRNF